MLELPRLGRAPRTWTMRRPNIVTARAALALLDAGAIPVTPHASAPADLVELGLKRWLTERTAGIRHFNFTFHYGEFFSQQARRLRPLRNSGVNIEFASINHADIVIGGRVMALERAITGLGQAVLRAIDAVNEWVPLFSPAAALRTASWCYWMGMDNEEAYLAEAQESGMEADDIEFIKRADFDAAIPHWASQPKITLDRKALNYLANPRRVKLTGKVARALIALLDAIEDNETRIHFAGATDEQHLVPQALFLRWSRKDPLPRIFDDWANDEWQAGDYREHISRVEAYAGDDGFSADIGAFLAGIEPLFPVLRALDALIDLLKGGARGG